MAIDLKGLSQQQLNDLITRAQTRQRELRRERIDKVRARLVALARAEGFSIDELFGARTPRKTRRPPGPKYRNPADPAQTWSGRGKRPHWFAAALAAGRKEKELLA